MTRVDTTTMVRTLADLCDAVRAIATLRLPSPVDAGESGAVGTKKPPRPVNATELAPPRPVPVEDDEDQAAAAFQLGSDRVAPTRRRKRSDDDGGLRDWAKEITARVGELARAVNDLIALQDDDGTDASGGNSLADAVNDLLDALKELQSMRVPSPPLDDGGISEALDVLDGYTRCVRPGAITGAGGLVVNHYGDHISVADSRPFDAEGETQLSEDAYQVFPVTLSQNSGSQGSNSAAATWTYDITHAITGDSLGTAVNPVSAPHVWKRPSVGYMTQATAGLAYYNTAGNLVITWINEVADQEACT